MKNLLSRSHATLSIPFLAAFCAAQAAPPSPPATPFTVSKETTVITAPLFPTGVPNYAAALDAQLGRDVTPENNLFVAYLKLTGTGPAVIAPSFRQQLLLSCGAADTPDLPKTWVSYSSFLQEKNWTERVADREEKISQERYTTQLWDENADALFAEYLRSRDQNLDDAVRISTRPRFWIPWTGDIPWLFSSAQLPSLAPFRQISRALDARALLRAGHGDIDRAIPDALAALRISRTIQQDAFLITRVIGIADESFALRTISAIAATGKLSAAQCDTLRKGSANAAIPRPLRDCLLDGERYGTLSFINAIAMGAGKKDYAVLRMDRIDWDSVLKSANHMLDDLHSILARPKLKEVEEGEATWMATVNEWKKESEAPDAPSLAQKDGEPDAQYTDRVTRHMLQALLPRVGRCEELERLARMEATITDALLLLAKQHAEDRTWPADKSKLSIPLPNDIYNEGHSVQYELTPEGPTLRFASPPTATPDGILGAHLNVPGKAKH